MLIWQHAIKFLFNAPYLHYYLHFKCLILCFEGHYYRGLEEAVIYWGSRFEILWL